MAAIKNHWVSEPDSEFDIAAKVEKEGMRSLPLRTIPDLFKEACTKFGSNRAMSVKRKGKWETTSFTQWYEQSLCVAKSLLAVGVKRYEGVSIMGFNSPEWIIAEIGTIMAGGLATGIYTTNNVETTKYILENSSSRVVFGEHSLILDKLLEAGKGIEGLKFVQYSSVPVEQSQKERGVISWEEFLQLGKDVKTEDVESVMSSQKPGQCTNLVYTSGTTGMPKGVMLSHDNLYFMTTVYLNVFDFKQGCTSISYLPLSHIAGIMFDIFVPMLAGSEIYFAERDAMKGTLLQTIKEVQPTRFIGVTGVWATILDSIEPAVKSGKLLLKDVRTHLGFNNTEIFIIGAALVSKALLEFFESANMRLENVYGCTETAGPFTFSFKENRHGAVGKVMEGGELKIHQPNSNGDGEICTRGRHVFMGYLRNPDKTAEVIDSEGWFHTGDLGYIDSEGFLWITTRIKELLIHSSGMNVVPIPIEEEMKKELNLCAFCMVVGEGRAHFNLLVTLKSKLSPASVPTDELDEEAVAICKGLGVELSRVSEAKESLPVKKYIQEGIGRANQRAVTDFHLIMNFAILPLNFSIYTGELTPTAKLKRSYITQKYAAVIDNMYA